MEPGKSRRSSRAYYYSTFDRDRSQLVHLYRPTSMLTFESVQFLGVAKIHEKITVTIHSSTPPLMLIIPQSLPFQKVQHKVITIDAQPSIHPGAIIVSVTGLLLVDEETNPMNFSQVFQLANDGGSYYVHNDIFRLNLG
ncbi:hypothetical protein JVU11DRAFT_261 [Chiua virens]|nr:hypothetical protein JVU11DRAFT_261 [Chiua virens]